MKKIIVINKKSNIMSMVKKRIDNMSYAEMLRHYKSPTGSILFEGEHRKYFVDVMLEKKSKINSSNIKIINTNILKKVYNNI